MKYSVYNPERPKKGRNVKNQAKENERKKMNKNEQKQMKTDKINENK